MGGNDFGIPIPILIPPFWILHIIPIPPNPRPSAIPILPPIPISTVNVERQYVR